MLPAENATSRLEGIVHSSTAHSSETAYQRIRRKELSLRVAMRGEHHARPHPNRARQFLPFAALKGFSETAHRKEATLEKQRELTPAEAVILSHRVSTLRRGDTVLVQFFAADSHRQTVDTVLWVDLAAKILRLKNMTLAFEQITAITLKN